MLDELWFIRHDKINESQILLILCFFDDNLIMERIFQVHY